jgi:hypothetical protein
MRIFIISPIYTAGVPHIQQEGLRRLLAQEGHQVEAFAYKSNWTKFPGLQLIQPGRFEGDFAQEFHKLSLRCVKERARLLFDLRRIGGELPESVWKFFKLAAIGCNLVDARLDSKDEVFLRSFFPEAFPDMPALLGSETEVSGYYTRLVRAS